MDREFHKKVLKSHYNILVCLETSLKSNDAALLSQNLKRLNELTTYLIRQTDIMMMQAETVIAENISLSEENRNLTDELFLKLSSDRGRYNEAKIMLDQFYAGT